jgi:superfamily I DNA/RNA helicase
MTVVGDVAQTGTAAGASSWADALRPHLRDAWRMAELTVNYRTPAEVMAVAAEVLAASGAEATAPRSVRSTGELPWQLPVDEGRLARRVAEEAAGLVDLPGTTAVVVPPSRLDAVADAVAAALPGAGAGAAAELTERVVVLTPAGTKGLEFDSVLVVDPVAIVAEGVRGQHDLYVALTRATQRLGVVHPGGLPAELAGAMIAR